MHVNKYECYQAERRGQRAAVKLEESDTEAVAKEDEDADIASKVLKASQEFVMENRNKTTLVNEQSARDGDRLYKNNQIGIQRCESRVL
tara:strand:- start:334 stop:600 length:267 start_codon:yes stop_codon:yes gene_type:complete